MAKAQAAKPVPFPVPTVLLDATTTPDVVEGRRGARSRSTARGRRRTPRFICSDMWKACLGVVAKKTAQYERKKPGSFTPAEPSQGSRAFRVYPE